MKAIVEQTGVQLIVATEARKNASGHLTKHTVSIVEELSQISCMAALQSLTPVDPSTAAYLVFTSGSTGCPKGILIEHASFCSALHHQLHHFDVRRDSRVFGFASYSFDISLHNKTRMDPRNARRYRLPTAQRLTHSPRRESGHGREA